LIPQYREKDPSANPASPELQKYDFMSESQEKSKRILCFTAYSANLRAVAIIRVLKALGCQVEVSRRRGAEGSVSELILTLIPNCWLALTTNADLAFGFKPHLNVTLPLLICKWRGIRTGVDVDDLDHSYRDGFLSKLVEWSQKPFPRCYDFVTYHHFKLRDFLVHHMGCNADRLRVIPQGVDVDYFGSKGDSTKVQQLRETYKLAGKKVAIYTAHLNVASDLEPILMAWKIVAAQLPDVVLMVVGGGPRFDHYREMAREMGMDSVIFVGTVEHEDVRNFFSIANAALIYFSQRFVNEYRCSLKLREYLAAGLPIVCNDFGELKQFAEFTYNSPTSVDAFAGQLSAVLQGSLDGREQRGQAYARQQLDWKTTISEDCRKTFAC
jgi:glycosyltransferase involved in cell wall biosynthesis